MPWNKALVPWGCAPANHGTRASFHDFYFCCLGKYSKTETGFETNFLPVKGENSIISYCSVLTFISAKTWWLVKEILVSKALGIYFLWILIASIKRLTQMMDGCLILNKLGSWRMRVREWWQHCSVNCGNVSIFIGFFMPYPNFAPLSPSITLGQGKRLNQNYLIQKGLRGA